MSLGLGLKPLGLGLGLASGGRSPQHGPIEIIKTSISSRKRILAKHNGETIVAEPYALFRADGVTMLHAVVIYSEAKRVRKFKPQDFDIATVTDVAITEDTFFPNWAFNADALSPEIIVAVELVEYSQNGEQTNPSASEG